MGSGGNSSGVPSGHVKGNVSFEKIVNASDNSVSFGKTVTVMPGGRMPQSGKKGNLGTLLDRNNINDAVIHMYRDRAGENDLKRMKSLGFETVAWYKGESTPGSSIPPMDYYYMRRNKKK